MEGNAVGNTFLFEREEELEKIDHFLNSANKGKIAIISGSRGVGKSALLRCQRNIIQPSIRTIQINMDRLRPEAVDSNQLVNQLAQIIADDEKNLGFKWKKLLSDNEVDFAVLNSGDNEFQTLVDAYPTELRPLEKAALTRKACIELLRLYSFHGTFRLLIVVDDIDYIDDALNTLLQEIILDSNITKVKILATCEDSDRVLQKLRLEKDSQHYDSMDLAPLSAMATSSYVHRLMQEYDFSILEEYVDWINNRSAGIPTLIVECFHYLRTTNHLIPSNTIEYDELLTERLAPLNGVEMDVISTLAIYGKPIKRSDAIHLFPRHKGVLNYIIEKLIFLSLITDDEDVLSFSNDQVRHKCTHIGGAFKINAVHERIAYFLYNRKENGDTSIEWSEIVDHLIATNGFLSGELTSYKIIDAIMIAVEHADEQTEFGLMYLYTKFAIKKLKDEFWEGRDECRIRLNLYCQRTAYLNNDLELMETCTSYLLENANSLEVKTSCIENAVDGYISKNRTNDAISLAIKGMKELGHNLHREPKSFETATKVLKVKRKLSKFSTEEALKLPTCDVPKIKSIMRLLLKVAHSAYGNRRNLFATSCCEIIELSLQHGLVPESAYAAQVFCSGIIAGYFRKITLGRRVSKVWSPLYTENANLIYSARSKFLFDAFIDYHISPLSDNVKNLDEDVRKNLEVGAYEMAAYSAHVASFHALDTHESLDSVNRRIETYLSKFGNITQQNADRWLSIIREFANGLTDEYGTSLLKGPYFDISASLDAGVYREDRASIFIAHHYATLKAYLCGNFDKAFLYAKRSGEYKQQVAGTYGEYLHVFISSITRARQAFEGNYSRIKAILYIRRALGLLTSICAQRSTNLVHKKKILEIILALLYKKSNDLIRELADTATSAQIKGHSMDALICYELAFDLHPESEHLELLEKSLSVCRSWGAKLVEERINKKIYAVSRVFTVTSTEIPNPLENKILIDCIQHINFCNAPREELIHSTLAKTSSLVNSEGTWLSTSHQARIDSKGFRDVDLAPLMRSHEEAEAVYPERIPFPVSANGHCYGYFVFDKENIEISQNLKSTIGTIADTLAIKLESTKAINRLKRSEKIYESLFSTAIDGIVLAKNNGRILQANRMFINMLDISKLDLAKENVYSLLKNLTSDSARLNEEQLDSFQSGLSDTFKQQYTITPNEKYSLVTLRRTNRSSKDHVYGYVIDVSDMVKKEISDKKIIQQARYFSSAVHEIKEPLGKIININQLSTDKKNEEKLDLYVHQQDMLRKLDKRFGELLSIGTVLEGEFSTQHAHVHMRSIIEDAFLLHKSECDQQNIEIDIQCDSQLTVISDGERIAQIVGNLIHNAIKYAQAHYIRVSASAYVLSDNSNMLQISIEDNGHGYTGNSTGELVQLSDNEPSHPNTGQGLATYIVRCLVAEIGGSIKQKTKECAGASFVIDIPVDSFDNEDDHTFEANTTHKPSLTAG